MERCVGEEGFRIYRWKGVKEDKDAEVGRRGIGGEWGRIHQWKGKRRAGEGD